ncbi:hypothetical protein AN958_08250 [Leucoagaricus sp. SymC.cos]|nr:hypothetical protein AN958_08250 [Leucoagaricus sp. SymC.cos]
MSYTYVRPAHLAPLPAKYTTDVGVRRTYCVPASEEHPNPKVSTFVVVVSPSRCCKCGGRWKGMPLTLRRPSAVRSLGFVEGVCAFMTL